jgi:uncharacterized protein (TIGR00730 family)
VNKKIAVYCSSSDALAASNYEMARTLGSSMCRHGYDLVFGGSRVGLMGTLARAVHEGGGKVTGVIPEFIRNKGIAYEESDELIVTRDMCERKSVIENLADGFIALPGGFGTLDELMEVLTLKQLQIHSKPVILLDVNGIYGRLADFFELLYEGYFAKKDHRELYFLADTCEAVFKYLNDYKPSITPEKWFG